jgi:hypothetical protein
MAAQVHSKQVFRLPDLLTIAQPPDYVVSDTEFQGCDFHGPAVFLLFGETVEFSGNTLPAKGDDMFWPLPPPPRRFTGVFGFDRCAFLGCEFHAIGIAAEPHILAQIDPTWSGQ